MIWIVLVWIVSISDTVIILLIMLHGLILDLDDRKCKQAATFLFFIHIF